MIAFQISLLIFLSGNCIYFIGFIMHLVELDPVNCTFVALLQNVMNVCYSTDGSFVAAQLRLVALPAQITQIAA